jgi:hypothetical protein
MKRFFAGEKLEGVTPVLEVAKELDENHTISLRDNEMEQLCTVPCQRGDAAMLRVGERVILHEYYLRKYKYNRPIIQLRKFAKFDEPILPLSALQYLLPPPIQTKQETETMTADFHSSAFPELQNQINSSRGKKICAQASFVINRIGNYFFEWFSLPYNRVGLHGRPPINSMVSRVTGLNVNMIKKHTAMV